MSRGGIARFASLTTLGLAGSLALVPARALADGAFPDEYTVIVPADKPQRVVVTTNFGVIVSDDAGAHWHWICEGAIAPNPFLYKMGAPTQDVMYAINLDGLFYSTPDLCTWKMSTFGPNNTKVQVADMFPDPIDPNRAFAIARPVMTSSPTDSIWESDDAGASFNKILYDAPVGARLESVEVAKSDPRRMYAVLTQGRPQHRVLLRSKDAGVHWDMFDQTEVLRPIPSSTATPRLALIAEVDPKDADTVYYRVLHNRPDSGDALAVTHDGGMTLKVIFTLPGVAVMTCFIVLPDGTLIVGTKGGGYISTDGGMTFTPWANSPAFRGIAERNGTIYAAADNFADGFACGITTDKGATPWKDILTFDTIGTPLDCTSVHTACDNAYALLKQTFGIDCGVTEHSDGGVSTPPQKKSCGCHTAGGPQKSPLTLVLVLAAGLASRRRPRRRRH